MTAPILLPLRQYAFHDANWNVTAIAGSIGALSERYVYAPYGQPTFLNASFGAIGASSFDWETLFAGYRFDNESGLLLVRERNLVSVLGAWLSQDPDRQALSSLNLYAYVDGRPTAVTDPRGTAPTFIGCGKEVTDCATTAYNLAVGMLNDPEYYHCLQSLLLAAGSTCDSGELTDCLNAYLANPTLACVTAGKGDLSNKYPCMDVKSKQRGNCKEANCAACADKTITINLIGSPGQAGASLYAKYCKNMFGKDVDPMLLASALVHEAAHSCVGEHSGGVGRDWTFKNGIAVDRCCRPDPYEIEKRFAECHGSQMYWRVPPGWINDWPYPPKNIGFWPGLRTW